MWGRQPASYRDVPAYQALLRVEDMQAISPPMFLAMQGRDPSGNYLLGSMAVP
jgi:hypothetical protein